MSIALERQSSETQIALALEQLKRVREDIQKADERTDHRFNSLENKMDMTFAQKSELISYERRLILSEAKVAAVDIELNKVKSECQDLTNDIESVEKTLSWVVKGLVGVVITIISSVVYAILRSIGLE